jgi:hypothetical protein
MKRVSTTADFSPSARVVDGTLVLSLPDAITPIVWRLDLGQAKASALEVRLHDDGTHVLVLRTPKGEIHEIAPYETKDGAVRALMAVSHAMQAGHGRAAPRPVMPVGVNDTAAAPFAAAPRSSSGTGRALLLTILGVVGIVAILTAVSHIGPGRVPSSATAGTPLPGDQAAAAAPAAGTPGAPATGVPMSADQFLQQTQSGDLAR